MWGKDCAREPQNPNFKEKSLQTSTSPRGACWRVKKEILTTEISLRLAHDEGDMS